MNIWSSIVHLGDAFFCRAGVHSEPSLDLLLSEALRRDVKGRQFWAINSVYQNPGTLGTLSKQAYPVIRGSNESYLAVVTPGFSDLVNDVPIDLQERYLRQVSQQLAIFKKRLVGVKLGCPSHFPEGVCKDIEQINDITESIVTECSGAIVDLSGLDYLPWEGSLGSRPAVMEEVADLMSEAILSLHSGIERWRAKS